MRLRWISEFRDFYERSVLHRFFFGEERYFATGKAAGKNGFNLHKRGRRRKQRLADDNAASLHLEKEKKEGIIHSEIKPYSHDHNRCVGE